MTGCEEVLVFNFHVLLCGTSSFSIVHVFLSSFLSAGCLNCSRISELTNRLSSLEVKVLHLLSLWRRATSGPAQREPLTLGRRAELHGSFIHFTAEILSLSSMLCATFCSPRSSSLLLLPPHLIATYREREKLRGSCPYWEPSPPRAHQEPRALWVNICVYMSLK